MTEQGSQDPFTPTERADVDRRKASEPQQRARKWPNGKTLMMKNPQGIFEYEVTVVTAKYDNVDHRWLYTLNDYNGEQINEEVPEVKLG
ncbi:hypothetical protein N7G274_007136 [Stereocaulon virgatum]|uniref:PepSY domain-containing protein n=1 Tax=Stereocaulon virgatum TaxID=373712 RepID=A0ABR4A590_9LECA